MPRPIFELSDAELLAVAAGASPLEQLTDNQLAAVAVQQGLLQPDEAHAAVVEKKRKEREPIVEKVAPMPSAEQQQLLSSVAPEVLDNMYAGAAMTRLALTKGGRAGDVAAGVLSPIAGAVVGGLAGNVPGAIAGGGAGGAAGDSLAQLRQYVRGERDDLSKGELIASTAAGMIPLPAAKAATPAKMILRRGAQGAGIALATDTAGQLIDTGTVDLQRLATTGALGALFGGGAGAVESAVVRRAVLKAIRQTPEFSDFKGTDADLVAAVKAKIAEPAPAEPIDVTPTSPSEAGALLSPTDAPASAAAPSVPASPLPAAPSAMAEFEKRAGMAAPAADVQPVAIPAEAAAVSAPDIAEPSSTASVSQLESAKPAEALTSAPKDLAQLSDAELLSVANDDVAPASPVDDPSAVRSADEVSPQSDRLPAIAEPNSAAERPVYSDYALPRSARAEPHAADIEAGAARSVPEPRGESRIGADPSTYLADPIKYAGELGNALAQEQRVSSIVSDYFAGSLPNWSPVGKLIQNAGDVGALMAPLRNPYSESYKIVVLDPQNRVKHAEVLHVGEVSSTPASLQSILRTIGKTGATRVMLTHNHPSGDPTPSLQDWRLHEYLRDRLADHNVELLDEVVTNGHTAYSLKQNRLFDIAGVSSAPWERVARTQLRRFDNPELVQQLAAHLRQSNPDSSFVAYLTQRHAMTALEQVPAGIPREILRNIIEAGAAREGAPVAIVMARGMPAETARALRRELAQARVHLADVVTDLEGSHHNAGSFGDVVELPEALKQAADLPSVAREDVAPYGELDPEAPVIARSVDPKGGYAKVRLAGLANIKIVQMPELVRLVRELTGKLPELRKLRGARGHFDSGAVAVRIDPRIFRDPVSAAKTLAHEIGHLVDYLDEGTLKRGNLLGRLHSLRDFLKNTFGASTVTNNELRDELVKLTRWWKPYDPAATAQWYVKYRESALELYADALSVLFNSPAELKAQAPKFWAEFFKALDKKPDTKSTLLATWDFLNKPHLQVLQRRSDDIRKMFVQGDEIWIRKAAEREARYATFRGWNDRLRQELFDTFDPLVRRAVKLERQGAAIPQRFNPRLVLDEHPLADNANYRMLQRLWENVVKPVEADSFTLHELGEYLFLQRVLNERFAETVSTTGRSELANPLGITPETARLGLLRMRLQAGMQRFGRLEAAAAKFHDIIFERLREAVAAGAYSRKTFDEVLAPNKGTYATFAVLDHLQDYVPAALRMQQGTFKEIANPFTATVLKTITINRLIQLQRSKQAAVEFLNRFDPGSIAPAPRRFDGQRWHVQAPRDPDKGLLELLDDGHPAGWHVDPAIAEMFNKLPSSTVSAITTVLNWPFRNLVYPLIIKYNPAFQLIRNPFKDARRSFVNMPRATGLKVAGEYIRNYLTFLGLPPTEAGAAVRAYLRGESHPLIAEMIARQAIGTPYDNFAVDLYRGDKMEQLLRDYGLLPPEEQKHLLRTIARPVLALAKRLEFVGATFENLPKVSSYRILTRDLGWDRREAAYFVRNNVGTPNIYKKGRHIKVADVVVPFMKIVTNGFRSDLALATNPRSAGGWWFRWALSDGIWTMLQAAAALGLLGAAVKELYDGISEYNKANYNVLPIGTVDGGQFGKRVVYVRFPREDNHRFISGLLYEAIVATAGQATKPGVGSVVSFGTDQFPGLNPILKIGSAWDEFLQGQNPMDGFRGRPVLSNAEWLAGGWPAYKGMIGFTLQNAGVTNFVRWDPNAANTAEMSLSAVPGLNTFLQTTDAGYRERQEQQVQAESKQRAELRLAMPDNVQRLLGEYYYLASVPAKARTIDQTQRLIELRSWQNRIYKPYEEAAAASTSFAGTPSPAMLKNLETASQPFVRGKR